MPDDSTVRFADARPARIALAGLSRQPKTLPPTLFYDDAGCRLFYRITKLPEYYLTRTEMSELHRIAPEVASVMIPPASLIEYGASNETKAELLLATTDRFGRPVFSTYIPIDVAGGALARLACRVRARRPSLDVIPVTADFTGAVTLPPAPGGARLGFFPGSTIGNLSPADALRFLAKARGTMGAGAHMLVGVDLRKDPAILIPAYDDAEGVTAAFNRNLLVRLNREAGADFDPDAFDHKVIWNDTESRVEMHLRSRHAQIVHLAGQAIYFAPGETIHTENSYKHTIPGFIAMTCAAGWRHIHVWRDPAALFSIHLLLAK